MQSLKLHQTQSEVARDDHEYRVVCCGRQWGKTTLAVLEMIACAYAKAGREVAYFATTYDQARNIAWAILKDYSRAAWSKSPNESRLELWIKTQDGGESRIALRGFENVETARGQQFDLLVIDEVAQMRNWNYSWQAILEPTLAFRKGKALFISTPLGFNFFYEMYSKGQKPNDLIKSWRFKSEDNPFLPKESIEKARRENSEDYFKQEYEADFRQHTGLAHKTWNRDYNLIEPFAVPNSWNRFRGFDYGIVDFTASVRVAVDDQQNMFIESSYLDNRASVKGHAEAILAEDYGLGSVVCWGDPSGRQWVEEFAMHGLHIQDANRTVGQGFKGWVEYCVERVNELLKPVPGHKVYLPDGRILENAPRMFVLNNGKNDKLVSQIERLSWRTTTAGDVLPTLEDTGDPTGGHYDLMAALRYYAVSYTKPMTHVELPKEQLFQGGFY